MCKNRIIIFQLIDISFLTISRISSSKIDRTEIKFPQFYFSRNIESASAGFWASKRFILKMYCVLSTF